jgi:hypothetical protein
VLNLSEWRRVIAVESPRRTAKTLATLSQAGFSPLLFSAFFSRSNGSDSLFSPSCSTDDWVAVLVRAAGEPDDVSDANHRIVCEIDL